MRKLSQPRDQNTVFNNKQGLYYFIKLHIANSKKSEMTYIRNYQKLIPNISIEIKI